MAKASSRHRCVAVGCQVEVPGDKLMCVRHWRMVPIRLQRQVWAHYRRGQEDDGEPSMDYLRAARAAIEAVRTAQSRPTEGDDGTPFA